MNNGRAYMDDSSSETESALRSYSFDKAIETANNNTPKEKIDRDSDNSDSSITYEEFTSKLKIEKTVITRTGINPSKKSTERRTSNSLQQKISNNDINKKPKQKKHKRQNSNNSYQINNQNFEVMYIYIYFYIKYICT